MSEKEQLVRIHFTFTPHQGGPSGEVVWAKEIKPGVYELRNEPMYVPKELNLAWGDIVAASPIDGDTGFLEFEQVLERRDA